MKKYLPFTFLTIILFCGCGQKSLNCSLQLDEDGALTTTSVNYNFNFWGKQTSREETTTITFDNIDDCNYYYEYVSNLYNNNNDDALDYTVEKDETTFTVRTYRNITLKNIDKNSLNDLTPKTDLKRKKVLKYYEDSGFECN